MEFLQGLDERNSKRDLVIYFVFFCIDQFEEVEDEVPRKKLKVEEKVSYVNKVRSQPQHSQKVTTKIDQPLEVAISNPPDQDPDPDQHLERKRSTDILDKAIAYIDEQTRNSSLQMTHDELQKQIERVTIGDGDGGV